MQIEFHGYAGDCTVQGGLELPDGRLSDVLNRTELLVVRRAMLTSLQSGDRVPASELPVERDELFAIEADGPTGEQARRVRMVRHLLRVQAGPYLIFGEFHALPGISPLRGFHASRRGLAPLTGCRVVFARAGELEVTRTDFLLVNLRLVDDVELTSANAALDEIELRAAALAEGAELTSVVA